MWGRSFWSRKRTMNVLKLVAAAVFIVWLIVWLIPPGESDVSVQYEGVEFLPVRFDESKLITDQAGLKVYATDGNLVLKADVARQYFQIEDVSSGQVWQSSPETTPEDNLNELTEVLVNSPFMFMYTTSYQDELSQPILRAGTEWTAYAIENGLQIHYNITNLNIEFVAEFVLEDGSLLVRIPESGIVENGDAKLTAIQTLPMFDAARQGDTGYLVIPDGSGSLTYFNKTHQLFDNRGYSKWVYGLDPTFDPMWSPIYGEQIAAPVFGAVKEGSGYVQIIEQGDADAKVNVNPPGSLNLPFYRGGFELYLRKSYMTQFGEQGRTSMRIEKSRIRGDRSVRFEFITGEGTDYADVASAARNRLFSRETSQAEAVPLVSFFHGVVSRGDSYSKRLETTTTFDQAKMIMDVLKQEGIDQFSAQLKGWYNEGYYGNSPKRFPADKDFGGNAGLKELVAWAQANGIPLSLEDNLIEMYDSDPSGVRLRRDAIRKPDNELFAQKPISATGWYRWNTQWRWLSPLVADHKFLDKELKKLDELGVESVDWAIIGQYLSSDYSVNSPSHRANTQTIYESWIAKAQQSLGSAGVYYGNLYAAVHADRVLDIPLGDSNDYLLDEEIPFLQMLLHGKVPYYSSPINRSNNADMQLLKSLEFGAIPSFELTYTDTTALKYTNYDVLFSAQYENWLPKVKEAHDAWMEVLQPIQDSYMTGHRRVTSEVSQSVYDNGTEVWVNYGETDYRVGDAYVKAGSYLLLKGGA